MSSFVTATTKFEFKNAEYHPAYVHRYGSGYELPIRATVYVRFGEVTMTLSIEDARALATGIGEALYAHGEALIEQECAEYHVDLMKAAA